MHLLNISIFLDVPTYSGDRCNTKMKKSLQDCSIQQGYRSATSLPPLPGPLPVGEGMHLLNISIFLDVPTYPGDRCNTKMKKFLQDCSIQQGYRSATSLPPLPPGEGWGEGASIKQRCICSSTL